MKYVLARCFHGFCLNVNILSFVGIYKDEHQCTEISTWNRSRYMYNKSSARNCSKQSHPISVYSKSTAHEGIGVKGLVQYHLFANMFKNNIK